MASAACSNSLQADESIGTHLGSLHGVTGKICASPAQGGVYCVPANQDPAGAWDQAISRGSLPIQMWAPRPDAIPLEALVADAAELNVWLEDMDKALRYVHDVKKNAESYRASLAGNAGQLLRETVELQKRLIANGQAAIDHAVAAFRDKILNQGNPIVMQAQSDQWNITAIHQDVERAAAAAAEFQHSFDRIATDFKAHRESETTMVARWKKVADDAATADLETLAVLRVEAHDFSREESRRPNNIILEASRLAATLQKADELRPPSTRPESVRDFGTTKQLNEPDFVATAARSLDNMIAYCEQRRNVSNEIARKISDGITARRDALIALKADDATRATISDAKTLRASAVFLSEITARVSTLWGLPQNSTKQKLPFLAQRYEEADAFVSFAPICAPPVVGWREAGCNLFNRHMVGARTYLLTSLPAIARMGLQQLEAAGIANTLLLDAQAKLLSGDMKGAMLSYDEAVRASDR